MKSLFWTIILLGLPIISGVCTIVFLIMKNYGGYYLIDSPFKIALYFVAHGILGISLGIFCAWNFDPNNCKIPTDDIK